MRYSPWGHKELDTTEQIALTFIILGFPGDSDSKESARDMGDLEFDPWVGKIP